MNILFKTARCAHDFIVLITCGNKMASVVFHFTQPPSGSERKRSQWGCEPYLATRAAAPYALDTTRAERHAFRIVYWWRPAACVGFVGFSWCFSLIYEKRGLLRCDLSARTVGGGHGFPKDKSLRKALMNRIRRESSWAPSKHSKVCHEHFTDEDCLQLTVLC